MRSVRLLVLLLTAFPAVAAVTAPGCGGGTRTRAADAASRDAGAASDGGAGAADVGPSPEDGGPPLDGGPAPIDAGLRDAGRCPEGATMPCTSSCGTIGAARCTGGTFGACIPPAESCNGADDDCDGAPDDGFECMRGASGPCTTSCGSLGTRTCSTSTCSWSTCAQPAESCNALDDDCDGACESGLAGCRGGVHRSYSSASGEHFYTRDRGEAACCGFIVEAYDYFWLYAADTPGLVAFYRCLLSNGYHFYTTSASCEGAPGAVNEGVLGWIATTPQCGSRPLYRLWHRRAGHFYTTDPGERDTAVSLYGFVDEGVAGHVWSGP